MTGTPADRDRVEYVLPLRWTTDDDLPELTAYLRTLSAVVPVMVVDGSPEPLFTAHRHAWSGVVRHVRPDPWPGANGKVGSVMTGLHRAWADAVVLADDDVRWRPAQLRRALRLLEDADVVLPQNVFEPAPWHARWDTARTLVNRACGGDWPGTLVVRRARLVDWGGYDGDVLFENHELVRTVAAHGGRVLRADDLYVRRRPPRARTFWSQRVRQAYDDLAQPWRLTVEAAVLPVLVAAAVTRRAGPVLVVAGASVGLAWRGRRLGEGRAVFPATDVALAPVWVAERAVCVWAALVLRARGGVPYAGGRLLRAGTSDRRLRARVTL